MSRSAAFVGSVSTREVAAAPTLELPRVRPARVGCKTHRSEKSEKQIHANSLRVPRADTHFLRLARAKKLQADSAAAMVGAVVGTWRLKRLQEKEAQQVWLASQACALVVRCYIFVDFVTWCIVEIHTSCRQ